MKRTLSIIFYQVIIVLLLSCQSITPKKTDKPTLIDETFSEGTVQQKTQTVAPINESDILTSLLPPISLETDNNNNQHKFDVKADKLPLNQFFMGLVEGTEYNMVVADSLTQSVTLHLNNVTIDEVLQLLQKTHGIDIRQQGNIYYVSGSEMQTVIYPLAYLNIKRTGQSETRVSSGQIMQNGNQQNNNNGSSGNNSNDNQNQSGISSLNSSQIKTETDTDLWAEIEETLKVIVQEKEANSYVMVSPQAGMIVVKARPQIQRQVSEFLGVAQNNLGRQVILEAKILEVILNDSFQSGINWQKIHTNGAGNIFTIGQTGQVLDVEASSSPINGFFNLLYDSSPTDPDPFNAAITLLEEQGNVQVLSSPRVSTINNQKAVIKVGTDEFFVTDISTTTVTGINNTTTPDLTLTPFFSGIALDVTPHISETGEIILHVHPSVSEVQDQTKVVTIGSDEFSFPLALSSVRESDSIIKTKHGQVVVIGGLMQNKTVDVESATPGLSKVPVLGHLFKQKRKSQRKSELVILLKASVIESNHWHDEVDKAKSKFRDFN